MPDDVRSISRNVTSLNIFVHDVINLLYYEHWTDKCNNFYVNLVNKIFSLQQSTLSNISSSELLLDLCIILGSISNAASLLYKHTTFTCTLTLKIKAYHLTA